MVSTSPQRPLDLRPLRPRSHRIPPLAALLFVICVLLVFNLSNWRFLRELQSTKQADLEKRLRSTASTISRALGEMPVQFVLAELSSVPAQEQSARLEEYSESAEYNRLVTLVRDWQTSTGLSQIQLITPTGVVVLDSSFRTGAGDPYLYIIDIDHIAAARRGQETLTPLYRFEDQIYQRIYEPVTDGSGKVLGLLQASISPDYTKDVEAARRRVLRLWLVSSLLLIAIGLSLYRVFGYLVRLERSTMQSARVEAMGALAGGLAHELRNPLAIVRAMAEEISTEAAVSDRARQNADDIVNETNRLGNLVTHFLSLSQAPGVSSSETMDISAELVRVADLLRKSVAENVQIVTSNIETRLLVKADERALRQLFLNLLLNAQDAVKGRSGMIRISAKPRRGFAEVIIGDNGPGIPAKELARVFEPFFTTRSTGSGLGLAISRSIVENLGGTIEIRSQVGEGTEVVLMLPLAQD